MLVPNVSLHKKFYVLCAILAGIGSIVGVLREQRKMKTAPPKFFQALYLVAGFVTIYAAGVWATMKKETSK